MKNKLNKPDPLEKLLTSKNRGIQLELGVRTTKTLDTFVGMNAVAGPNVDIVHPLDMYPYPLPDESCSLVVANHVLEYMNPNPIDPALKRLIDLLIASKTLTKAQIDSYVGEYTFQNGFIRFMDEIWRILKVGGQFAYNVSYGGSPGFTQDPQKVRSITEATAFYFDPLHESKAWTTYKPKPWKIEVNVYNQGCNIETILSKRALNTVNNEKAK